MRNDAAMTSDHTPVTLTHLRAQIDEVDNALADLLNQRFALVTQVATYKQKCPQQPVEDSAREEHICARLATRHPQYAAEITEIYRHLFVQSKRVQRATIHTLAAVTTNNTSSSSKTAKPTDAGCADTPSSTAVSASSPAINTAPSPAPAPCALSRGEA